MLEAGTSQIEGRIKDIVSKPGVKEVLQRMVDDFNRLPGRTLILGITVDGLFVAVRENMESDAFNSGYFRGFAANASLPVERIEQEKVEASFSYLEVDRRRDGGTTIFPGSLNVERFGRLVKLSDEEVRREVDEREFSLLKFYKATGGFHYPSPLLSPKALPLAGRNKLYPLPL